MTFAVGWLALIGWWIGIAFLVLAVIPPIVLIGNRIVSAARVIRLYSDDIAEHAGNVAALLEEVEGLRDTQRLAGEVHEGARRAAEATSG